MLENQKIEAQGVLNELRWKGLIPFDLSVGSILEQGPTWFLVHFYDSRLHSVEFSCEQPDSFKEVFRNAVLNGLPR